MAIILRDYLSLVLLGKDLWWFLNCSFLNHSLLYHPHPLFSSLLPQAPPHFLSFPFFCPFLFPSLLPFLYFFPPSPYLLSLLPRQGISGSESIHTFFSLRCLLTHWFPKRFCQLNPILCECPPSAMQGNAINEGYLIHR